MKRIFSLVLAGLLVGGGFLFVTRSVRAACFERCSFGDCYCEETLDSCGLEAECEYTQASNYTSCGCVSFGGGGGGCTDNCLAGSDCFSGGCAVMGLCSGSGSCSCGSCCKVCTPTSTPVPTSPPVVCQCTAEGCTAAPNCSSSYKPLGSCG